MGGARQVRYREALYNRTLVFKKGSITNPANVGVRADRFEGKEAGCRESAERMSPSSIIFDLSIRRHAPVFQRPQLSRQMQLPLRGDHRPQTVCGLSTSVFGCHRLAPRSCV